jgi:hypothetical protein
MTDTREWAERARKAQEAVNELGAGPPGTATRPARANRNGSPCPPWCTTDHDEEVVPGTGIFASAHGAEVARIPAGGVVRACLLPSDGIAYVHVSGGAQPLFVPAADAEDLACFAELLAHATPDQHRDLAAAIRRAAAQATEAGDG